MTASASLAFVAAPAVNPTVTLSLDQPGSLKVLAESFSLGGPSWDGDPLTGLGEYGTRDVSFTLQFTGSYAEVSPLMQKVARQLTQRADGQMWSRNWLMVRWSSSDPPLFVQTYLTSLDALDFRNAGANVWELPVQIRAADFLVGAPVDFGPFTITNDPTSGTNRMIVGPSTVAELGAIRGDLQTPLMLAQTAGPGVTVDPAGQPGYLASYSLAGGNAHSFLARDLTELTSSVDVGSTVTGAGSSYIGGNYKHCSFASGSSPQVRLFGSFTTPVTPMPGQYRMLLRMVAPTSGALNVSNTTRVKIRTDGSAVFKDVGDPVTTNFAYSATVAQSFLLDFGVVQFPTHTVLGPSGFAPAATTTPAPYFQISAEQTAAGGGIRFDELFLIPCDTNYGEANTAIVRWPTFSATLPNNVITIDGVNDEMATRYDASGTDPFGGLPVPATDMSWVGGLPVVYPGRNNYLQLVYNALAVGGTATFTARYYPRYAYLPPAAS